MIFHRLTPIMGISPITWPPVMGGCFPIICLGQSQNHHSCGHISGPDDPCPDRIGEFETVHGSSWGSFQRVTPASGLSGSDHINLIDWFNTGPSSIVDRDMQQCWRLGGFGPENMHEIIKQFIIVSPAGNRCHVALSATRCLLPTSKVNGFWRAFPWPLRDFHVTENDNNEPEHQCQL